MVVVVASGEQRQRQWQWRQEDDDLVSTRGLRKRGPQKRVTKAQKLVVADLPLGNFFFGCAPRVVLPPQQPVLNATMEQVERWREDVSNDGLDAFYAH